MPVFFWKGINQNGVEVKSHQEADTEEQLKQILFEQHIALLECRTKKPYLINFTIFSPYVATQELATFFEHLSMLVSSGITMLEALKLTQKQATNLKLKVALNDISNDISKGMPLSSAAKKHPSIFTLLICSLLLAGEQTGKFELILNKISAYLNARSLITKEIKKAAFGPSLTLGFAVFIILGIFIFVIPQFQNIFANLGKELPTSTRAMFTLSNFLTSAAGLWLLGFICLFPLLVQVGNKFTAVKWIKNLVKAKMPFVSKIKNLNDEIYVLQTINLSLTSGVSLKQALEFAAQATNSNEVKAVINSAIEHIVAGGALNLAFSNKDKQFFPDYILAMIAVGEQTGKLENVLEKATIMLEHEMTVSLNRFTVLLQPLLLIGVGIIIAAMMLSVYMPIFSMANLF